MEVLQFSQISDFVAKVYLKAESRFPDFFIYNYSHTTHEGFDQLLTYRQHYFEINLEITQSCSVTIDQFTLPFAANRLTLVSPHRLQSIQAHTTQNVPPQGYGLFFNPEFINTDPAHPRFLSDFPFFNHLNSPAIRLDKTDVAYFQDILAKIQHEHDNPGEFSKDIIQHYLKVVFLKAKHHYQPTSDHLPSPGREQEIYSTFKQLVHQHFLELHSVKAYADKLHVSPKHLSETVKKVSGQSALQVIHDSQLHYAKALLFQTNKTVSEIAYDLNFENPDYFSVFFKRLTGKTPLQFRTS